MVRLGQAARQLHPHQQTFATTNQVVALGPMLATSDRFRFLKNSGMIGSRSLTTIPETFRRSMVETAATRLSRGPSIRK
jgi:hypothetical protein